VVHLPPLYAIVDEEIAARFGWTVPALARACLAGGAGLLQLRAKRVGSGTYLRLCDEVVGLAAETGATVIINDRADLARLSGAAGVHLGQDDLEPSAARDILGSEAVVGLSTHAMDQARGALAQPVDYLAIGPVFGSTTKDTGYPAVGLGVVSEVARLAEGAETARTGRPVVAIGGITLERAEAVLEAGAASVAVISDLLAGGNPEARVRAYVERLSRTKPHRGLD
jgi:thiamine-phosphate pyrophosphorylase